MSYPNRLKIYAFLFLSAFSLFWGVTYPLGTGLAFTRDYTRPVFLALFAIVLTFTIERAMAKRINFLSVRCFLRKNVRCFAFLFICATFCSTREAHNFKVTADEYVLSAEAMVLHYEGLSQTPTRMYEINGVYQSFNGNINKRPPVFVVALSFMHDIIGYRMGNVFILNTILTYVFFGVLFISIKRLFNSRAAYFGSALFASLPLLYQNAAGGGFEMLNMVLMLTFLLAVDKFMKEPSAQSQRFMVLVALLLANTRYESAVFSGCAVFMILAEWIRSRRVLMDLSVFLLPLVMFTFLLRLKVVELDPVGNWQIEAGKSPFSYEYFYENVGHALNYFFAFSNKSTTSELVSLLGGIGLAFLIYAMLKGFVLSLPSVYGRTPLLAVTAVVLGNFLLLLNYHWGQLDAPEVSRLALPVFILLVIGASFLFFDVIQNAKAQRLLWLSLIIYIVFFSIPRGAIAQSSNTNYHVRRADWSLTILKELSQESFLVASMDAQRIYLERIPAIPIELLNLRVKESGFHLKLKTFNIYAVQNVFIDPVSMSSNVVPNEQLHPAYLTTIIAERSFRPFELTRIVKITGIDPLLMNFKPPTREVSKSLRGDAGAASDARLQWFINIP